MKIFDLPIETERLILRRVEWRDHDALFPTHSDPDVCRYLPYEPRDAAAMQLSMEKKIALNSLDEGGDPLFLVAEVKETAEVVGEVLIFNKSNAARQGEVGYVFSPNHQRKGYGFEATRAFMDVCFEKFNFHRISARCSAANDASWRLMEKLGMRREADLREHDLFKGEWDQMYIYAILEDEWRARATKP